MALYFHSFASGSSGNSYLVRSEQTALLVDCGISGKKIKERLACLGLTPSDLAGLLISHEHIDHVRSLKLMARAASAASLYASPGTFRAVEDKVETERTRAFRCEDGPFRIGDITVYPFRLSHDALEPVGYMFEADGRRCAIITDTGIISQEVSDAMAEADLICLEANHEENLLLLSSYPYTLKQRILSPYGHLSNDDSARCAAAFLHARRNKRKPHLFLAHLSRMNNSPEMAALTFRNTLFEQGLMEDKAYRLDVLAADGLCGTVIE